MPTKRTETRTRVYEDETLISETLSTVVEQPEDKPAAISMGFQLPGKPDAE